MDADSHEQGRTVWGKIYHSGVREYDILGHTCAALKTREQELLACARDDGQVRILLLNPVYGFHSQLHETAHLINWQDANPLVITQLRDKIMQTVRAVLKMKAQLGDKAVNVQVRFAPSTIYHSITRAGDTMCVTHYLSGVMEQGQSGPSFVIRRGAQDQLPLFQRHCDEFNSLWNKGICVERVAIWQDRLCALAQYLPETRQAYQAHALKDPSLIPLPVCAIVFPTYRCEDKDGKRLCGYCSFADSEKVDVDPVAFETVVRLLCISSPGPRVRALELAGGGEPLQHPSIGGILETLHTVKTERPGIEFGLLTNGMHATSEIIPQLSVFDYVRVSIPERYSTLRYRDGEWDEYRKTLTAINHALGDRHVGIKLLVTRGNISRIPELATWAFDTLGAQHVKVKAVRFPDERPSPDALRRLGDKLWTIRCDNAIYSGLSVDFPEDSVSESRTCWISPLLIVVDPMMHVYKCCNISRRRPPMCRHRIEGVTFENYKSFLKGWRSREHMDVIEHVDVTGVCNNPWAADCRFVEYQRILEGVLAPFVEMAGERRPRML